MKREAFCDDAAHLRVYAFSCSSLSLFFIKSHVLVQVSPLQSKGGFFVFP